MSYADGKSAPRSREHTRRRAVMGDLAGAQTLMREIDELLRGAPAWAPWSAKLRPFGPGYRIRPVHASADHRR
jgi:hypothetical protein